MHFLIVVPMPFNAGPVSPCALQKGRSSKKGLYSSGEPPVHHLNDVSLPGTAAKAKQYLPFFQRGRHNAVVEFVLSGSRLKVRAAQARLLQSMVCTAACCTKRCRLGCASLTVLLWQFRSAAATQKVRQ